MEKNVNCRVTKCKTSLTLKVLTIVLITCTSTVSWATDYNILDFGAQPNSSELNTTFIQNAIDKASADGGGRVVIPTGRFLTGTIELKSGVELHIVRGGMIVGSGMYKDYRRLNRWNALILADGADHIGISGKGIIDGQGAQVGLHMDSLFYAGALDSSLYNFGDKRPKAQERPQLIEFVNCDFVNVRDITLLNAASWVQTYEICMYVSIQNVTVDSDAYWNNDGIDIIDCQKVKITGCDINSSDDGICIKSEEWDLTEYCDSIRIENCRVRSSASAIKFGTSSVSQIKNVVVRNIKIYDTYRSAIAIESVQGGIIKNILVENISAKNTGNAIFVRIGRIRNANQPGVLEDVTIRNMVVKVPFQKPDINYTIQGPTLPFFHNVFPSSITGVPGFEVKNLSLENIKIIYPGRGSYAYANMPLDRIEDVPEMETKYPEFSMFGELPAWGLYVRHVNGLTIRDVTIKIRKPDDRMAIVYDDVEGLTTEGINIVGDKKKQLIFNRNTP